MFCVLVLQCGSQENLLHWWSGSYISKKCVYFHQIWVPSKISTLSTDIGMNQFFERPTEEVVPTLPPTQHLRFVVRRMMLQHVPVGSNVTHSDLCIRKWQQWVKPLWVNTAVGQIGPNRFVTCWGQYRVRPMWFTRIRNHTVGQWCLLVPFFSEISFPRTHNPLPGRPGPHLTNFVGPIWPDRIWPNCEGGVGLKGGVRRVGSKDFVLFSLSSHKFCFSFLSWRSSHGLLTAVQGPAACRIPEFRAMTPGSPRFMAGGLGFRV